MSEQNDTRDLVDLNKEHPPAGDFEIKCLKCGSTEVEFEDSRAMGSSWTGAYGCFDLACKKCGNRKVIADT